MFDKLKKQPCLAINSRVTPEKKAACLLCKNLFTWDVNVSDSFFASISVSFQSPLLLITLAATVSNNGTHIQLNILSALTIFCEVVKLSIQAAGKCSGFVNAAELHFNHLNSWYYLLAYANSMTSVFQTI